MAKLKDFIERTFIGNTDENQKTGNADFDTYDYVFFESKDEVKDISSDKRFVYASDYAVMNGAMLSADKRGFQDRRSTWHFLRSAYSIFYELYDDGSLSNDYANKESSGLCPALNINLESIISARSASGDFALAEIRDKKGNILYHTIEIGAYPQDKAKNSDELEKLYKRHSLVSTGKTYTGYRNDDGTFTQNQEYEYGGKRYVRVVTKKFDDDSEYKDKTKAPKNGTILWAEVQPIKWKIKNWEDLPTSINPKGNGTAKTIYIKSEEAIMSGIPFYPENGKTEQTMWQNSMLRAFFNGYDLHEELNNGNGNKKYKTDKSFNFKGKGFLEEAFNFSASSSSTLTKEEGKEIEQKEEKQPRRSRLEKLNPDTTPVASRRKMTDTEMIKSWIDAGQSVLLRGPSGIGKTERLKKSYPDLIYIKLTNNMFPEKVVGSMNLQTGQSIPPDFAKQAILSCATEDERKLVEENIQNLYKIADDVYERSKSASGKTVILLDELLNVKPAVQSLVYTLVLNKLVETGKGLKLPANTVVVATGNQKKYSSVSEDLAEPLEKRFDHILDMEPKVGEWIYEYAIPSKIHPSVIGYIFSKYQLRKRSEKIEEMGYFYEEPEVGENHLDKNGCRGRTNDPRGWVSISNSLYAFEEDLKNGKFVGKDVESLLRVSINSKLREEWAEEFFDFYNHPTLTVEEVVEKRYTQADFPRDINEKFATIATLLNATESQVGACREFIRNHCDPEYLSVYDLYWVGNDEKRMEKISELSEISTIDNEIEGGLV